MLDPRMAASNRGPHSCGMPLADPAIAKHCPPLSRGPVRARSGKRLTGSSATGAGTVMARRSVTPPLAPDGPHRPCSPIHPIGLSGDEHPIEGVDAHRLQEEQGVSQGALSIGQPTSEGGRRGRAALVASLKSLQQARRGLSAEKGDPPLRGGQDCRPLLPFGHPRSPWPPLLPDLPLPSLPAQGARPPGNATMRQHQQEPYWQSGQQLWATSSRSISKIAVRGP